MITLRLILALITIESGGNNLAIGDNDKAIGCLQIHSILVQDVNRFAHTHYLWPDDCKDGEKSIEICKLYLNHYCTKNRFGHEPTEQDIAKTWNEGPQGFKSNKLIYWAKVSDALDQNKVEKQLTKIK